MIKLTIIKKNKKPQEMFFKVKDIKAIKVVDGKTHVFIRHASFILGEHIVVKESPHAIGMAWIQSLVKDGKGIGINGVL